MNYLELYNDVLLVVLEERPTNADRLFKAMNNRPVILNAFEKGSRIVLLLNDSGLKYLSTDLYE